MKKPKTVISATTSGTPMDATSKSPSQNVHVISDLSEDDHPGPSHLGNHNETVVLDTDTEIHKIAENITQKNMSSRAKRKRKSGEDIDSSVRSPQRKKSKSSVSDFSDSSLVFNSPHQRPEHNRDLPDLFDEHMQNSSSEMKQSLSKHKKHSADSVHDHGSASELHRTKRSSLVPQPVDDEPPKTRRKSGAAKQARAPPTNTVEMTPPNDLEVWAEHLEKKHIKLFLCQLPAKMDVEFLQEKQFKPGHLYKYHKDKDSKTKMEITVSEFSSKKMSDCITCVTHRKSIDALDVVKKPLSGVLTVTERVAVPPTPLPTITPKPPRELPPGLKQRHIPFGADHPSYTCQTHVCSQDSNEPLMAVKSEEPQDSDRHTSVKKKKTKKKKKKIKQETDNN